MTEAEWLACTDPQKMLAFLGGKVSDRKLRLFAVACCHHVWSYFEEPWRNSVTVAEQFADAASTTEELNAARDTFRLKLRSPLTHEANAAWAATQPDPFKAATVAASLAAMHFDWFNRQSRLLRESTRLQNVAAAVQCSFLLDIIGNPFQPIAADHRWLTPTVLALTRGIYDDRAFDRLPILADALEEAGCDNASILGHCRGPGPHCRGCWVVDLLLAKE